MPPKKAPPAKAASAPPPKQKKKKQFVNVELFGGRGRVQGKPKKRKDIRQYLKMHGGLFTTIAAGGTTVAGKGQLPQRNHTQFGDDMAKYCQGVMFIEDNMMVYMDPGDELPDKKENLLPMWEKMDALEKKIGMMWINALPRYTKQDGNPLDQTSLPTNKPQPPPPGEDTAQELQWW